jgi:acyl dehydratase
MSGFYGNAIVAMLEVRSLRALKPVFPGDTVHVRAEVTACDCDDTRSRYGQLHVDYSVRNQRDEEVMHFTQIMLARRTQAD